MKKDHTDIFEEYTFETREEWLKKHYNGITEKELYDTYKLRIEDLVTDRIERYDLKSTTSKQ